MVSFCFVGSVGGLIALLLLMLLMVLLLMLCVMLLLSKLLVGAPAFLRLLATAEREREKVNESL